MPRLDVREIPGAQPVLTPDDGRLVQGLLQLLNPLRLALHLPPLTMAEVRQALAREEDRP